ncbi:MAG: hypothetical protein FWH01_17150 [Oscillospiraceae bacterium]|nr:hypothetical protein [Oscillospiraceae bacterium]
MKPPLFGGRVEIFRAFCEKYYPVLDMPASHSGRQGKLPNDSSRASAMSIEPPAEGTPRCASAAPASWGDGGGPRKVFDFNLFG